jgi:hypothetical protein
MRATKLQELEVMSEKLLPGADDSFRRGGH